MYVPYLSMETQESDGNAGEKNKKLGCTCAYCLLAPPGCPIIASSHTILDAETDTQLTYVTGRNLASWTQKSDKQVSFGTLSLWNTSTTFEGGAPVDGAPYWAGGQLRFGW